MMSKEKRRVPKLRFPGFTEDWEQRKFKDIAFKRGKISEADLPYVEFEDINSGIGTLNKNILQKVGHKKGIVFEAGDVLFGKLRPYLQNWLLCQFMGIAVGDFWVFQPQIVSSAFLYYLIQSEAYQSVANISSGTKMPRSSWSLVSETRFSIPKYKEATMIGEFLTSIDKNITLHQRKLDNLKLKKKALLQKLFPKNGERYPELRFPGFTDAWEQRELAELCNVYDGTHQTPRYTNSGVMFVSVENIKTLESDKYISEDDFKNEFKIFPEFGDILLTRIGDVGSANIILDNIKRAYYVSLALLKPKGVNSLFLLALLSSASVQSEIWKRTLHIAFPKKINKNEISKVIVSKPSILEQKKIGELIYALDQIITLHQ